MSDTASPSMASLLLRSLSVADSEETDVTSRSSTSSENRTSTSHVSTSSINSRNSKHIPWILYRILECQLSGELPLRIMFAYNSGQRLPTLKQAREFWAYRNHGKALIAFLSSLQKITPSLTDTTLQNLQTPSSGPPEVINPDHHPSDRFMDTGNDYLLNIDFSTIREGQRKSDGLPLHLVQTVCLQQIFPEDFDEADLGLALTGLDYIRDIELTRRESLREAAEKLGITQRNWHDVLAADPDAKRWVEQMQSLEIDITDYYATIFIDLRVWTLIKELQTKPFYKPNLLAMLNTLFPPSVRELPNDKIDKAVMYKFRAHFYDYILSVEKHGPEVLKPWLEGKLSVGCRHSWPETRNNLLLYFDIAGDMLETSRLVYDIAFFQDRSSRVSGTTMSTEERPATARSSNSIDTQASTLDERPATSQSSDTLISQTQTFEERPIDAQSASSETSLAKFQFERPATTQSVNNLKILTKPLNERAATTQYCIILKSPPPPPSTRTASVQTGNSLKGRLPPDENDKSVKSAPTPPNRAVDNINPSKTRKPSQNKPRTSSLADRKKLFEPPQFPLPSRETFNYSNNSAPSLRLGTGNMQTNSSPGSPQVNAGDLVRPKSRLRTLSRAPTPVIEQGSEAARHESFATFIPSREQKRLDIINRREAISGQSQAAFELNDMPPQALDHAVSNKSLATSYQDRPTSRMTGRSYSVKAPAPLINDGLEFLKRPYEPETPPLPPIPIGPKKKSSFSSMFQLRKNLSSSSIATVATAQKDVKNDSQTGLGIELEPSSMTISTESFPRFSQDTQATQPGLKKQVSFSNLEKTGSRLTIGSIRARAISGLEHPRLYELVEEEKLKAQRRLMKKASLPNMSSRSINDKPIVMKQKSVAVGDDELAYVPVRAPPQVSRSDKEARKARSIAALHSTFGASTASFDAKKVQRRKSSKLRHEPVEGDLIRSKTISEPFAMEYHNIPSLQTPESQSKEWTRKWLIEEARAKRNGMIPPAGDPIKDFEKEARIEKENMGGVIGILKKEKLEERVFEFPRATPMPPERPNKQRWDSIFPRRAVENKRPTKHVQIDLSKYAKNPEKEA